MAFFDRLLGKSRDLPPEPIESTVIDKPGNGGSTIYGPGGDPISSRTEAPGEDDEIGRYVKEQVARDEEEKERLQRELDKTEEEEGKKKRKEEERLQREADRIERGELEKEKAAERLATDIAVLKARGAKAEAEKDIREAGGTGYAKTMRALKGTGKVASTAAGMAYKLGTLGGPVKMRPGMEGFYASKGMRPLTGVEGLKGMRKLTTPGGSTPEVSSERMLRMVSPSSMAGSRIGRSVLPISQRGMGQGMGQGMGMGGGLMGVGGQGFSPLRQIALLEGQRLGMGMRGQSQLPKPEQEVLTEINRRGNSETPSQIIKSLSDMGIPRPEAINAIRSLLQKKVIRQSGERFGNEPVLEVSR